MNNPKPLPVLIDGLQYCRWSRKVFEEMRAAGMSGVHATIGYHGGFRDIVRAIIDWNALFRENADLILHGRTVDDIALARATQRTAIFFGLQTPMPIEDDLGLVEVLHVLGVRFMQLTYNNQSLLGSGWTEAVDSGVTRMGREVIGEMNRLGMVIDMSHAGERTTLDAIDLSSRPLAVTHANPDWWRATLRNKSANVLRALAGSGGILGLSLYPQHMLAGGDTSLEAFCAMAREAADVIGVDKLAIGSDLCQDQPDDVVRWMREGRWMRPLATAPTFPPQPRWFRSNLDFPGLADGLGAAGFWPQEVAMIMGENWLRFMVASFPAAAGNTPIPAKTGPSATPVKP
jgi:membrane dipeptidase